MHVWYILGDFTTSCYCTRMGKDSISLGQLYLHLQITLYSVAMNEGPQCETEQCGNYKALSHRFYHGLVIRYMIFFQVLVDVTGEEFESLLELVSKLSYTSTVEGSQEVFTLISEQAELTTEFKVCVYILLVLRDWYMKL